MSYKKNQVSAQKKVELSDYQVTDQRSNWGRTQDFRGNEEAKHSSYNSFKCD